MREGAIRESIRGPLGKSISEPMYCLCTVYYCIIRGLKRPIMGKFIRCLVDKSISAL